MSSEPMRPSAPARMNPSTAVRHRTGRTFIGLYRLAQRTRGKAFSLLASGGFAHFGSRSVIQPPVRLEGESRMSIGDDVFVGRGSWLRATSTHQGSAPLLELGDGTSIVGDCVLSACHSLRIGRKVLLARNVYIADHMHTFSTTGVAVLDQGVDRVAGVEIGDGAWLAQNVVVGPGVRIGRGAVIGANAVVLADVPDYGVAVGAPARVVRVLDGPRGAADGSGS